MESSNQIFAFCCKLSTPNSRKKLFQRPRFASILVLPLNFHLKQKTRQLFGTTTSTRDKMQQAYTRRLFEKSLRITSSAKMSALFSLSECHAWRLFSQLLFFHYSITDFAITALSTSLIGILRSQIHSKSKLSTTQPSTRQLRVFLTFTLSDGKSIETTYRSGTSLERANSES